MNSVAVHLWQSTVFVLFAAGTAFALRRSPARIRHAVWMTASIKFLIPFSVVISLANLLPWAPEPAEEPSRAVSTMAATLAMRQPPVAARVTLAAPAARPENWAARCAFAIWLAGALALLAAWTTRWRSTSVLRRDAVRVDSPLPVPLFATEAMIEPGVFGIFRPVLIVPASILREMPAGELEAILAHELEHVRRRDNLTAAIHMFTQAAFWFHPALWWIGRQLVNERERACDEAVVAAGAPPEVYAQGLIGVCKAFTETRLPCVAGTSGGSLTARVGAILSECHTRRVTVATRVILAAACAAAVLVPLAVGVLAQPSPAWRFEVASIRPSDPERQGSTVNVMQESIEMRNWTAQALIQWAYSLPPSQLSGGPEWIHQDRFDILAKDEKTAASDSPDREGRAQRARHRVRALLDERCGLRLRSEEREIPVYVLSQNDGKTKLRTSEKGRGTIYNQGNNGVRVMRADGLTSKALALALAGYARRPVVDETGLSGLFDFELNWSDDGQGDLPSLLTAVKEQLGLRLDAAKRPVNVSVVEAIHKPSEN